MNANSVTKSYSLLTPEERFSLILAADGRGDEPEVASAFAVGDDQETIAQLRVLVVLDRVLVLVLARGDARR